jgi:hydroxyacylglutathione hydrolase
VIIERSMHPDWLSNSYLVGDESGGTGVIIDAGGPVAPLLDAADVERLTVTHLLITHADGDHIDEAAVVIERHRPRVLAHEIEAKRMSGVTGHLNDGDVVTAGGLEITALFTPGHSPGHLSFLVGDCCFTADVLFKDTVGGTMRDSYESLHRSIMEVLMKLPPETRVLPGHTDPTTIGDEWERNPFIRIWRGADEPGAASCTVAGRPATLLLFAGDYDGGHKGWVRWEDGTQDIVPGSRVQRT